MIGLRLDLMAGAKKYQWNIHFYPSPGFLCSNPPTYRPHKNSNTKKIIAEVESEFSDAMGYFVDAYDWVMVPKMSNFSKRDWTEIWDGLFWRFVQKHSSLFSANIRTLNLMQLLRKNESSIILKIEKAKLWLAEYKSDFLKQLKMQLFSLFAIRVPVSPYIFG